MFIKLKRCLRNYKHLENTSFENILVIISHWIIGYSKGKFIKDYLHAFKLVVLVLLNKWNIILDDNNYL